MNDLVARIRACRSPDGVATRIVAIDGHGGAGKTTLAARLAEALGGVPVAHTDDFASWEVPIHWWPRCIEQLLIPLARGATARYEVTQWGDEPRRAAEIRARGIVILEGVTAAREAFRPYLAFAIFVDTPRDDCIRRGLERDGEHMREEWERGFDREAVYIARERPDAYADVVVRGDSA